MGSRMGTRLPMIFVKGQPAKLHEMTLNQLRKFVPFLVRCETRKELPPSTDNTSTPPTWWPSKLPFSRAVLYDKKPPREMTQRLVRIVSRCYAEHNSSYLIAFSSSLAGGNGSQAFGKLTIVELEDGTTRILNSKGQLVVVVRTTTRHYDREDFRQAKKRRRSARLVTLSTLSQRGGRNKEMYATDFNGSEQSPIADDEESQTKRQRRNVERTCRKPNGVILAENAGNQMTDKHNKDRVSKETKSKEKERIKLPPRPQRMVQKPQIKLPCKHCGKEFTYQEILEEHETQCSSPQNELIDIRDDETRKEHFMATLGLLDTLKVVEREQNPTPAARDPIPEKAKPAPRSLRKVASRNKIVPFIRAHPIPITCKRGQKLLESFGERLKAETFDGKRVEYEKYCKSIKSRVPKGPAPIISTLKKHTIKDNQYVHQFSFSNRERRRRDVELTVGLARKSFKLFNKCKQFSVLVERLDEPTFMKFMEKRQKEIKAKQLKFENMIKKCTPSILLIDFMKHPDSLPLPYQNIVSKFS